MSTVAPLIMSSRAPRPPPDTFTSQFAFDRYGVRVPAVIVSPFVPPGAVHTVFDHTSIPATLTGLFGLPRFLSARDAAAKRFDGVAALTTPRTKVPDLSRAATGQLAVKALAARAVTTRTALSDFQRDRKLHSNPSRRTPQCRRRYP